MNCILKVNCRKKFGLVCQLLAEPALILFYNSLSVYNSLSAAIHLYMIQALLHTICSRKSEFSTRLETVGCCLRPFYVRDHFLVFDYTSWWMSIQFRHFGIFPALLVFLGFIHIAKSSAFLVSSCISDLDRNGELFFRL